MAMRWMDARDFLAAALAENRASERWVRDVSG